MHQALRLKRQLYLFVAPLLRARFLALGMDAVLPISRHLIDPLAPTVTATAAHPPALPAAAAAAAAAAVTAASAAAASASAASSPLSSPQPRMADPAALAVIAQPPSKLPIATAAAGSSAGAGALPSPVTTQRMVAATLAAPMDAVASDSSNNGSQQPQGQGNTIAAATMRPSAFFRAPILPSTANNASARNNVNGSNNSVNAHSLMVPSPSEASSLTASASQSSLASSSFGLNLGASSSGAVGPSVASGNSNGLGLGSSDSSGPGFSLPSPHVDGAARLVGTHEGARDGAYGPFDRNASAPLLSHSTSSGNAGTDNGHGGVNFSGSGAVSINGTAVTAEVGGDMSTTLLLPSTSGSSGTGVSPQSSTATPAGAGQSPGQNGRDRKSVV